MPDFDKTDDVLARKLAEIAPPADLRARLLAIEAPEAVEEARPARWWVRGITALAALLIVTLAVLSLWPGGRAAGGSFAAARTDMAAFLSGGFELAMQTSSAQQVREWLAGQHPNHPVTLPRALAQHSALGCRELEWQGHRGMLACFEMGGGREAHLAMFPSSAFTDAPGDEPKIARAGDWNSAAWSRDGMTYILFVPEEMDPMRELAAGRKRQAFGKIVSSSWWSTVWPLANSSSGVARISSPDWT